MRPADWQALAQLRAANEAFANPFFDPGFAYIVGRVRGDIFIGLAHQGDRLAGAWPLQVARDGWSRPAGAPFADWAGPLLARHSGLTASAFLDGLGIAGHTGSNMPAPPGGETLHEHATVSLVTQLGAGGERVMAQLAQAHPRHFKKLRRLHRKLEAEHGPVRLARAAPGSDALDRLLEIKREHLVRSGLHDVLAPAWTRAMLEALHARDGAAFCGELHVLEAGGRFVAAEFNLRSGPVMHGWLAGYDPGFASYSPGHLLMMQLLPHLAGRGFTEYDAGDADHPYKAYFANARRCGVSATLFPAGRRAGFRPVRRTLGALEHRGPDAVAGLLARSRRRLDQICAAEPSLHGRARGAIRALRSALGPTQLAG